MLVVGAGGFIGDAVVRAAARRRPDETIHALVHNAPPADLPVVRPHWGDATRQDLGLDAAALAELRESVSTIVISVGSVRFDATVAEARDEHVLPLLNVIEFAESCANLEAVVLVSSVVAVGEADRRLRSDYVPAAPRHRNFYEWAKLESEKLLLGSGLPARVVRPGHVLGATPAQRARTARLALFDALPAIAQGLPFPVRGSSTYWAAPVDFVADVILAMCRSHPPTTSVWAVDPRSPTVGELLDVLALRHGLRSLRLPPSRLLAAVGGTRRVRKARPDLPHHLFDYATSAWDLDLRCLLSVVAADFLSAPSSLAYLDETIDFEMSRASTLV